MSPPTCLPVTKFGSDAQIGIGILVSHVHGTGQSHALFFEEGGFRARFVVFAVLATCLCSDDVSCCLN